MNDSEFHQLVDQLISRIEQTLDAVDADIDYEINEGVMRLIVGSSQIVINRQEPLHQVWLAAKTGGYHFNFKDNNWFCDRSGKPFFALLSETIRAQSGAEISFDK